MFGLSALFFMGPTMLLVLFAACFVVNGVFSLIAALRAARRHDRWGLLVLNAVLSIVGAAVAIRWLGIATESFVVLVAL